MKILIVEDNPAGRNVLRRAVEHFGHEVVEAGDGEEGLGKASPLTPHVL